MCPLVDMFNHNSSCNSEASFNYFNGCFELRTGSYDTGDQVFISYGKQSNDRFLQYYGFVEKDNINDLYDFGSNILEMVLKYAEPLAAVVDFPTSPIPEERMRAIASGLQATYVENQNTQEKIISSTAASDITLKYYRNRPNLSNNDQKLNYQKTEGLMANFDDTSVRCVRALVCSESEWMSTRPKESMQIFAFPLSQETEDRAGKLLSSICFLELRGKSTTIEQDEEALDALIKGAAISDSKGFAVRKSKEDTNVAIESNIRSRLINALIFRLEKKKLLLEACS